MTSTLFCIDFDETLSNTDRMRVDLQDAFWRFGGEKLADTYPVAYEATRAKYGIPRLPLVLKTMAEQATMDMKTQRAFAEVIHTFPHQEYIYPGAEQAIQHLKKTGPVIVLSDGDAIFQTQKIHSTSIKNLVDTVVVLPNKIEYFEEIAGYWPAERYVFIDDKQKVLDAAKSFFGERATTVLVRQGRYTNPSTASTADISVASIAEVADLHF